MLVSLSIRNVVLIERLDLEFGRGLTVLTGETGAGKSILLDALGLALGARAESGLLRHGAEQASVTAAFSLPADHPSQRLLREQDLEPEEGALVLRRVLGPDGRSRAFVNDQPASVGLLRSLGDLLVEVQGQFEQRGLLDAASHRGLLDAFAGLEATVEALRRRHEAWRAAAAAETEARDELEAARRDEAYLRHALEELDALAAEPGEEERLAEERAFLMNAEKLAEALQGATDQLAGNGSAGAASAVAAAQRTLERLADKAGRRLEAALGALDRAAAELAEAESLLAAAAADLEFEPGRLEAIDERFFALKDLARKHGCSVAELPALQLALRERLTAIDTGTEHLESLARATAEAERAYRAEAEALSARRRGAAGRLDAAINRELPPLKLDKARFSTGLEPLAREDWGPAGAERVAFTVSTNPGAPPGPLAKIASGGELSRFLLALKVVLAGVSPVATLVFDEVDSGIGGATAAAVGERLARLAAERQILVVTHSPQVAARGLSHWVVQKDADRAGARTRVAPLDAAGRTEEVARMLSGAQITEEARRAAEKLMTGAA
ncbi:DNA replication and repair protein RecN [Tistlia consotensis]|uniref:DNA repair protein RecN n=1 Tax=Tistlia consotensis USBA 355 TaxID=560819 RepID=A0A1Y6CK93_9PROT|nr:DNA repair protein RecN [Tistlia consotensis]SMF71049.1 DNA replication and repair protein RecN [Tistlia consotensis USBA 355]SNS06761.1 DNA replication and repair protein RecN [Tistlia consotensis]